MEIKSLTYLSGTSQLNIGFSSTSPPFLCLSFSHWFGIVAGWGPVSVSLKTIMTTVAACIATCFTISFMPSESVVLVCMLYNYYIIAFVFLCLPSWDFLILTPFNLIGLLWNDKDAVYYYNCLYTSLLCLNIFQTGWYYILLQFIYTLACLWAWIITLLYMTFLLMLLYTYVYACNYMLVGNTTLLFLQI